MRAPVARWRGNESMEWIKDLSDKLVIWLLRASSGFGKELTDDGKREQELWREQRIRNLRGLSSALTTALRTQKSKPRNPASQ